MGQPPTGIERRPIGHDALVAQQRFKPQERCHGPDFVNLRQQRAWICVGKYAVCLGGGVSVRDSAKAQSGLDIGVWFIQYDGIGVCAAHCSQ